MGGPVLQAFINLSGNFQQRLNQFSTGMNKAVNQVNALNTKLNMAGRNTAINTFVKQQNALGRQIAATTQQYNAQLAAHRKMEASLHRQGMSTGRLITMMVKFGIILKALQLVTAPLMLFGIGTRDVITTDKGVRNIMGMLGLAESAYRGLTKASRDLQIQHGLTAEDVVKGQYKIASVISSINWQGTFRNQAEAITGLTGKAATLAVGGFIPLEEAASGLATIMAAMRFEASAVDDVLDTMFQTIAVGSVEMGQLSHEVGTFLPFLAALSPKDTAGKMRFFDETMGMFGYLTTMLPVAEAATSQKRILQMAGAMTPEGKAMGKDLTRISGGTIGFGAAEFAELGPKEYFSNILRVAGPQSKMLAQFWKDRFGTEGTTEQLMGLSTVVLDQLFGDSRALVGVLALANDEMSGINAVWDIMNQKQGAAKRAADQGAQSFERRLDKIRSSISVFAQEMMESGVSQFFGFGDRVVTGMAAAKTTAGGQDAWDKLAFDEKMTHVMNQLGPVFQDAGEQMAEGMVRGLSGALTRAIAGRGPMELLGDAINNPIARGAGVFFSLLSAGMPWPLALALSVGAGATAATGKDGKPLLDPNQQGIFTTIAAFAILVGSLNLVSSTFRKMVAIFLTGKHVMGNLFAPLAWGWRQTARMVPGPGGQMAAPGAAMAVPGMRGRTAAPIPGMMVPGMGYMPPPVAAGGGRLRAWPYNQRQVQAQTQPRAGGRFSPGNAGGVYGVPGMGPAATTAASRRRGLGAVGRGLGAAGGAFGNMAVMGLVFMAFEQVLETVILIAQNWDKFVYALKSGKLNEIPIFGVFFNIAQKIMQIYDFIFGGNKGMPSNMEPNPKFQQVPPTQFSPGGTPLPVPGADPGKYKPVSAINSMIINFQPRIDANRTDNPTEFAAKVVDAMVSILDEATGNSGDFSARTVGA